MRYAYIQHRINEQLLYNMWTKVFVIVYIYNELKNNNSKKKIVLLQYFIGVMFYLF